MASSEPQFIAMELMVSRHFELIKIELALCNHFSCHARLKSKNFPKLIKSTPSYLVTFSNDLALLVKSKLAKNQGGALTHLP